MRFNRFIFDCYLLSPDGKNANVFFENFIDTIRNYKKNELLNFLNFQYLKPVNDEDLDWMFSGLGEVFKKIDEVKLSDESDEEEEINTIEAAEDFFKEFIKDILSDESVENNSPRQQLPNIEYYSLILYYLLPEYFFPYFFVNHFYKIEKIFSEFNIPLPQPPTKRKYLDRLLYYFELCKVVYDFRKQANLTPIEINVFFYFFASKIIDDFNLAIEMPTASKVYISGASKGDSEWLDVSKENDVTFWAGNLNTLPGDIILVYEISPTSSIKTIWRALTSGFYDPFSFYSDRIWVGKHIKIPAITFTDLNENEIWKNKGIVKAHMQGISGTPCTKEEYIAIHDILKKKNFDTSKLPDLEYTGLESDVELNNEKDVEEKLLEPLLNKLGFTEKDWIRQMPLRMGRGERVYPDYVLHPKDKKNEESGFFLWEAKFSIKNRRELLDAFWQSKSYAMRLNTEGLGIISKEGIWVSLKKDQFISEHIIHYSWIEINKSDNFNKLRVIFNNKK